MYVLFDPKALWSNTDITKLGAKNKIIIRQTGDTLTATLDTDGVYCMDTVHFIYESQYDFKFLLGLINSKFLNTYHRLLVPESGKAFAEVKISNLQKLPIPRILRAEVHFTRCQSQIVAKVDSMLEAKKQLVEAKTDKDKTYYESRCVSLDRQIDRLVYDLYGLTEKEIQIVEQPDHA
jgi:adenine-specific DNA-methyltransferase